MSDTANKTTHSFCNICMIKTEHDMIHSLMLDNQHPDGSASATEIFFLLCRGCKEPSVRKEYWYFDYIPDPHKHPDDNLIKTVYMPPRIWRRPPEWLPALEEIDPDLKGLLGEVYSVTNDQQVRLLSMGVRSVLDHVMRLILGSDEGGFEQKLNKMVENGHLTKRQGENLSIVIDAGSASTHRGYRPPRELVEEMVVVMENIVRDYYITGPMLKTAKTKIPPRPQPRKN